MAMTMAVPAQGKGHLLRHRHCYRYLPLLPQIQKNHRPFHGDSNADPVAVDEGQSQKKSSGVSSSFSRMVRRIQIAYDRIRFKGLPPQLRDVAASASANAIRHILSSLAFVFLSALSCLYTMPHFLLELLRYQLRRQWRPSILVLTGLFSLYFVFLT